MTIKILSYAALWFGYWHAFVHCTEVSLRVRSHSLEASFLFWTVRQQTLGCELEIGLLRDVTASHARETAQILHIQNPDFFSSFLNPEF